MDSVLKLMRKLGKTLLQILCVVGVIGGFIGLLIFGAWFLSLGNPDQLSGTLLGKGMLIGFTGACFSLSARAVLD